MEIILNIGLFLLWLLLIYGMHRASHKFEFLKYYHNDHHKRIYTGEYDGSFKLRHLLLIIDSKESIIDQWLTEVIPTIIFCLIFNCWWLLLFYYIYAAILSESFKHNKNFNWYPVIISGRWHLIHHKNPTKNYGIIFPIWDKILGTEQKLKDKI